MATPANVLPRLRDNKSDEAENVLEEVLDFLSERDEQYEDAIRRALR